MTRENQKTLPRGIERIFNDGSLVGMGDGQLLREYATSGDEAAFEALVTLHGPMVLRVCRRRLYDPRDVEDAFQATFLVLLRRADSIGDADALGCWLHGVAYRVSSRVRANAARRRDEERNVARAEAIEIAGDHERHELRAMLDEEIHRLPERYRKPVVLCYLEGRTQEEAARRLRCTAGSVRGRLDRAREKLRARLLRRGLAPAAGLVAAVLDAEPASAAVPPRLVAATVATLGRAETARAVAAIGVSAAVRELADGLVRTMWLAKIKLVASALTLCSIVLAVGVALSAAIPRPVAVSEQAAGAGGAPQRPATSVKPQPSPIRRAGSTMEIHIEDHRSRKPLAGVALTVTVDRQDTSRVTTDHAGRASIAIPAPVPDNLAVTARKDGFATMTGFIRHPTIQAGDIPASYTLALHPVETVSGIVRDENGKSIAGVLVEPMTWMRAGGGGTDSDEFERPVPVKTDAQGRWRCDDVPAGLPSSRVSFKFSHADYQPVDLPTGKALEHVKGGAVTVLPRGLEISGRVVDKTGRPIARARVSRGADRFGMGIPQTDTDAAGRFRFPHVAAGETILTVQATGYGPDLKKIAAVAGSPPVEFRIEPGRTIRGRVVDTGGTALAAATLVVDRWRGHRTLDFQTTTDDEGGFQWTDAPPDTVTVVVMRAGYLRIGAHELPPGGNDLTITMVKELKARGLVVDAQTRHSVPTFTLVPGLEGGGASPTYWDRSSARSQSAGRYEITFDRSAQHGHRLRIEADGYLPAISRQIRDGEEDPVINFVLEKGAGVSGVALLADGSPVVGADVVLVTPSQPTFITNGRPPDRDGSRVVKTGDDGRFSLPSQEPPFTIVVLHDRGFAEHFSDGKSTSTGLTLTVRPWGRVAGTVRIGSRPGSGESVSLAYERQGDTAGTLPWWSGHATCDATGQFVLERVMPGEVTISREIAIRPMTTGHTHAVRVDASAGETAHVNIGGTGRPVIGRVNAGAAIAGPVDWSFSLNWLHRKQLEVEPPAALDGDAKQKWYEAWRQSPDGKALRRTERWYTVKLEADGSFRVDDVDSGVYELIIAVQKPPLDPRTAGLAGDLLGTAQRDVAVAVPDGARSDTPLDLGQIALEPVKTRARP